MLRRILVGFVVVVAAVVVKSWLGALPGPGSLTGVTWQWTELMVSISGAADSSRTVPDPEHYTLTFYADGTVGFIADCNRSLWTFTTEGGSMELRSHAVQWSRCSAGSRAQEFVDVLWRTNHYSVWFGQLVLEGQRAGCPFSCDRYRLTFKSG